MKDRIIVALDFPRAEQALALVDRLGPACTFYKVGLELYTAVGPAVVRSLRGRGKNVFLDLKLHDIPNTVARATARAGELGVRFLTIHAMGGAAMLQAAAAAAPGTLTLLGVTVLTSLDAPGLGALFARRVVDVGAEAERLAAIVRDAGVGGVVVRGQRGASDPGRNGPRGEHRHAGNPRRGRTASRSAARSHGRGSVSGRRHPHRDRPPGDRCGGPGGRLRTNRGRGTGSRLSARMRPTPYSLYSGLAQDDRQLNMRCTSTIRSTVSFAPSRL